MKYKDYYKILGVERNASADEIKKAYRKLAHKFHPDVSREANAKERFQEIGEAYDTLKNPEKRAAYDQLGSGWEAGEDFRPPPGWQSRYAGGNHEAPFSFDDLDLADLFAGLARGEHRRHSRTGSHGVPGQDFEVNAQITLEQAAHGAEIDINLSVPEYDDEGVPRRVPRAFRARIARGASEGQRMRLPGKGGKGRGGARDGDLWLNVTLAPHPLFRPDGHDLYVDLALAPWEAVLGANVEVPTLEGPVRLKVPAGTRAGQKLRLAGRGLPRPRGGSGDLYAVTQIVVPTHPSEREKELYARLAQGATFDPRAYFKEHAR